MHTGYDPRRGLMPNYRRTDTFRQVSDPNVPRLWWVRIRIAISLLIGNAIGTAAVYALTALVVPLPPQPNDDEIRLQNLIAAFIFLGIAFVVGTWLGARSLNRATVWIRSGRSPSQRNRYDLLRTPRRIALIHGLLWGAGAWGFALWNARWDVALGALIFLIISLAGGSVSAFAYMLTERGLRPLARVVLAEGVPKKVGLRLGIKIMVTWLLGTGLILTGIVAAGFTSLWLDEQTSLQQAALTMVVLGGTAFAVSGLMSFFVARSVSDPIRALRSAMDRVARGKLDTEVEIYDATEIGILQAGFNEMVGGLRERERVRDLFGRHVGEDVARAALTGGIQLGGEVRHVAVLFVDIVGSTTLATQRPPDEVVELLNRFFDIVIEVVHEEGGLVNKFEGDAALVIFGAPVALENAERAALRAARKLSQRLTAEFNLLRAGIGVSAGECVAGNVGAAERYEYTVIGDPVNEAARLTELSKQYPALVAANSRLLAAAGREADYWQEVDPVVVRGRSEPTPIATLAS